MDASHVAAASQQLSVVAQCNPTALVGTQRASQRNASASGSTPSSRSATQNAAAPVSSGAQGEQLSAPASPSQHGAVGSNPVPVAGPVVDVAASVVEAGGPGGFPAVAPEPPSSPHPNATRAQAPTESQRATTAHIEPGERRSNGAEVGGMDRSVNPEKMPGYSSVSYLQGQREAATLESVTGSPRSAPSGGLPRSKAFRDRAKLEADRYGPDPWIFVRELLQNSRDAGATSVRFEVGDGQGQETVTCVDDGEGMSFDHARRYLFALYASSKEDASNQAGKFGVGFWSILRFDPESITIRSCPRGGEGWGLRLDGSLEHATRVAPLTHPGTEITVVRRGGDGRLLHRVFDAVWQSGRYLYRRDNTDAPLPVTVNGKSANAPFTLDAPSAAFRRGTVRGVVGLGTAPRVELFSRGLRVRSAASLEDLIAPSGRHTSRMRVQFPELPGGLAPVALLESDQLEVMLSRSDARDNRALAKLVKLAQQELERLIEHQLSHSRPIPFYRKAWEWTAERLRESLALRTLIGSAIGAGLAGIAAWLLWGMTPEPKPTVTVATPPAPSEVAVGVAPRAYQDLGARYRGPKVDVLTPGSAEPVSMRYTPATQRLHFASLRFSELGPDGSPVLTPIAGAAADYIGVSCDRDCVDVSVPVQGSPDPIRIAVPTGHRVVEGSVRTDGRPVSLMATEAGHPSIVIPAGQISNLQYRTVRAPDPTPRARLATSTALPRQLVNRARSLTGQQIDDRVDALLDVVQDRVRYDRTPHIATRHQAAIQSGHGFIARTLDIGAGDCDVQNGLLVALLHAAGVEARLAVGFIGNRGMVFPWLHAWVEYRDEQGRWSVADASEGGSAPPFAIPAPSGSDDGGGAVTPRPSPPGPGAPTGFSDEVSASAGPPRTVGAEPGDSAGEPATSPAAAADAASQAPTANDALGPTASTEEPRSTQSAMQWLRSFDDRWPWILRSVPFLLFALAGWSLLRGRTRRAMKLDQGADLSRLLQGVLQQPAAFGQMSALFTRPLVPLINGNAISLNRARQLASLGRLYRTLGRPKIARSAMKSGASVLDDATAEGRTVADALGAVDLDRWSSWLDHGFATAVTLSLNSELRARGEDWGVLLSKGVPGAMAVLDLATMGAKVPRFRASRIVLLDADVMWVRDAMTRAERSPRTAAFILLDIVIDRLDLPIERRARLLAGGARRALEEGFGE